MADVLTPQVSDRICSHMNDDHADAVLLYAKAYGGVQDAIAAEMLDIDPEGMNLQVKIESGTAPVRILFDHPLPDSDAAHQTLTAMVKQARPQSRS